MEPFRNLVGPWEKMTNEYGTQLLARPEAARAMHGATAAGLKAQEVGLLDPQVLESARTQFERALLRNIKGVSYFASSVPVVGATPRDLLMSRGPMRLHHDRPRVAEVYRIPVLLVMATTNRGYIFDMVPRQSFAEFLLDRGFLVAGGNAIKRLWPRIDAWLAERSV